MIKPGIVFEVDGVDYGGDVASVVLRREQYVAPPHPTFGELAREVGGTAHYTLHIDHAFFVRGVRELQLLALQKQGQVVDYAFWPNGKPGPKFSGRAIVQDSTDGGLLSFEWPCEERPVLTRMAVEEESA